MTVSSTTIKTAPFAADGATVTFAFSWKVWKTSEVKVILRLVSDGSETVLTEGTAAGNYSVTLSSDLPSAGSITTVTTYSNLYEIVIKADFPYTQEVDYGFGDRFPSVSHEEALDRGVRLSQQFTEQFGRALLFPESTILEDVELPEISSSLVGFFLGVNNTGSGIEWGEPTDLGNLTAHNTATAPHVDWYASNSASGPVVIATDNQVTALNSATAVLTPGGLATAFPFVDGDILEISWGPSNYTRDASIAEANDASDIAAHLKGIDTRLAAVGIAKANTATTTSFVSTTNTYFTDLWTPATFTPTTIGNFVEAIAYIQAHVTQAGGATLIQGSFALVDTT
ncbi:hypothetical protein LCGC14_1013830, partial [marine sediment metagenome]